MPATFLMLRSLLLRIHRLIVKEVHNIKSNAVLLQFVPHIKAYTLQFCDQYSLGKRYVFEQQWPC